MPVRCKAVPPGGQQRGWDDPCHHCMHTAACVHGPSSPAECREPLQPPALAAADQRCASCAACCAVLPALASHFPWHAESFCSFVRYLRRCGARDAPVVFLHPTQPADLLCTAVPSASSSSSGSGGSSAAASSNGAGNGNSCAAEPLGPARWVQGSPAEAASLRAAGASKARALVYLARSARPVKTAQATGSSLSEERGTREAVLADASALLACYGVGEESGMELTHAVVELLFTTSIE